MPNPNTYKTGTFKTILWLGFLTGSLDAIAAMLLSQGTSPEVIFKFIASAYFGKPAFAGGIEMVIAGVIFHYLIAYIFTLFFYMLYPFFNNIFKNKYVVAVIFGGICWVVMNMVVMPFTQIGTFPVKPLNVIKGVSALIICIGLPVVLVADRRLTNNG